MNSIKGTDNSITSYATGVSSYMEKKWKSLSDSLNMDDSYDSSKNPDTSEYDSEDVSNSSDSFDTDASDQSINATMSETSNPLDGIFETTSQTMDNVSNTAQKAQKVQKKMQGAWKNLMQVFQ